MKEIFFIFNGRFPSEKADSLFAVLDAKSFADEGVVVKMIVPRRLGRLGDVEDFYGISINFPVIYLPIIDGFYLGLPQKLAYFVSIISFSLSCLIYSILKGKKNTVYFSNEIMSLYLISFFADTFYEMHDYPESKRGIFSHMAKRMKKILIHNKWKTDKAVREFSLKEDRIITIPNAVSIEDFDIDEKKEKIREKLGIPMNRKVVMYTGHFYSWKGVDLLVDCAIDMSEYDFYFIGGNADDVNKFKNRYTQDNIHFLGFKPHSEMPLWQKASDCLVIPNTAKENISKYYTSPMKLFEYMASGVPVVASDIPSIREIVGPDEVVLFEPDSKLSLKKAINFVFNNGDDIDLLARNARLKVGNFSWRVRAKKIIDFIYGK